MKKDKKQSRLESAILNETSISRKQKEKIFEIIGKKIPILGKVESPALKNVLFEQMTKANPTLKNQRFDSSVCSTRLKTVLNRISPDSGLTVGEVSEMALNGQIESEKNAGIRTNLELIVILNAIYKKGGKMRIKKVEKPEAETLLLEIFPSLHG